MLTDHSDPLAPLGGYELGGEVIYVRQLSKALSRHGWTIDIFTRWSSAKTAQIAKLHPNVRVIRLKAGPLSYVPKDVLFPYMTEYINNFLAFREQSKLDYLLLHGNYYFSAWAANRLAKLLNIPSIVTFHSLGVVKHQVLNANDPSPKERTAIETEVMEGADRVIATSPFMKDAFQTYYHLNPKKIVLIPGGVNLKRFEPVAQKLARRILHFANNKLIVLYVGRMERRKGIDTLLRAMGELATAMPKERGLLRLYITGGEPRRRWKAEKNGAEKQERDRLNAIVEELGIKDIVRFVGGVDRELLPYYYNAADVTVVPSIYEPFGLVPLEAMACGSPVVASRVGGMEWTVKDGKTGFLVPPQDAHAFAQKIQLILADAPLRQTLKEHGIDRVKHMFSWETVGDQMSSLYHDVLIEYFYQKVMGGGPARP